MQRRCPAHFIIHARVSAPRERAFTSACVELDATAHVQWAVYPGSAAEVGVFAGRACPIGMNGDLRETQKTSRKLAPCVVKSVFITATDII